MFNDLLYRLRALFRRDAVESELNDELRFHFDNEVDKYIRQGMPREAATSRSRKTAARPMAPASSKPHCKTSATRFVSFAAIPDLPSSSFSPSP